MVDFRPGQISTVQIINKPLNENESLIFENNKVYYMRDLWKVMKVFK